MNERREYSKTERLLEEILNELRALNGALETSTLTHLTQELKTFMSTTQPGLAALTQSVTDLTAAVTAAVNEIASLSSQLSGLNSEDPQVQSIATQIEAQVSALKAAFPAAPAA